MYCTVCHTPFSWRTGRKVFGTIHNPHFYQWQRDQNDGVAPRVPGGDPNMNCGGLPTLRAIETRLVTVKIPIDIITQKEYSVRHRLINHIQENRVTSISGRHQHTNK